MKQQLANLPRLVQWFALWRPGAPLLLDAFCGAGGAAMGYWRAGFNVIGCDIAPQPHYPFPFWQMDALDFIRRYGPLADAIHASPPCQFASRGSKMKGTAHRYTNMIPDTRRALQKVSKPYIIENVPDAAQWLSNPIMLDGHLFGLRVVRARLFECVPYIPPPAMALVPTIPMVSTKSSKGYSSFARGASHITVAGHNYPFEDGQAAMEIWWMANRSELSESIPPAYTEWIGAQMMCVVRPEAVAVG